MSAQDKIQFLDMVIWGLIIAPIFGIILSFMFKKREDVAPINSRASCKLHKWESLDLGLGRIVLICSVCKRTPSIDEEDYD